MRSTKRRIFEVTLAIILGLFLLGSGIWLGWTAGRKVPLNITISGVSNINTPSSTGMTDADFSSFWQAWQTINDNYLREPSTTAQEKVYGAISGLVSSLGDPYSEFFTPQDNQQFQQDVTGDFGGIGAQLGVNDSGNVVVIAALKGTPADNAGLKPEDVIMAINGSSTDSMSLDDAVNIIRGPVGSPVTLSILRDGWNQPRDFKIVRATIQVPNVEFEMKGDIAHITLSEFTQDAEPAFYQALVKSTDANAKGIILDLRDDPGGYLEVAVDLAGYFLKPGSLVVKEVGRTVPEQDFNSSGNGALDNVPMVLLVNGGTASAAEILSGALHDDRGVKLVGEKTFGKGTVQELEQLNDGSSIKLTVAHWVLPSGRILDHDGLVPDYVVSSTAEIAMGASSGAGVNSTSTEADPQLEKAVSVLQAEIASVNQ